MAEFAVPREIHYGKGSLQALEKLEGRRAVICLGGGSMKRFGFVDKAVEHLSNAHIDSFLVEGIESDPSVETVLAGADRMREIDPDLIIAMGGGSVIDAAKAMWVLYEHPETTIEDMGKPDGIPKLRAKARFCAIPSTSGTASEVTRCAVVTNLGHGTKLPLAGPEIIPDIAVIDPALAATMPWKIAAHTGMDALTHAIESYVSPAHSNFSDALAIQAIKLISANLVNSCKGDEIARGIMHEASTMAGMAFSNSMLGISHSMAHKTGAAFADLGAHISHGAANAMYLPKVIAFNANATEARVRYAEISDFVQLGGIGDREKTSLLIEAIIEMNRELNIPQSISEYGTDGLPAKPGFIPKDVFEDRLPVIARDAIGDVCTMGNPRQPNQKEMQHLLMCCYLDEPVKV